MSQFFYGTTNEEVMKGITDPTLKQAFSVDDPTVLATHELHRRT